MIVLDSDHVRVLRRGDAAALRLAAVIAATGETEIVTTIITAEESLRGWLAEIHKAAGHSDPTVRRTQIGHYATLGTVIEYLAAMTVLPFDEAAFDEYERLRALRLRSIQTTDLKIAAITLSRGASLASGNLAHFQLVPGLAVRDYR